MVGGRSFLLKYLITMFFEKAVNIWKKIGAAVLGGDEIGMVGLVEVK